MSGETLRGYTAVFELFLRVMPEVGDIEDLQPQMLIEFFKRIDTRARIVGKNTVKVGVKGSTIKTQWSKLNVFFSWLQTNGHIKANPLTSFKPPHPRYEDPKALENNSIHKLYAAISLHSINSLLLRRDIMMLGLLLYCGLRKSELLALHVRDVDIIKREVVVRAETSKTKNWRVLKIHPTLLLHIQDYYKERKLKVLKTGFLLVSNKGDSRLTADGLKHWVVSISKKSGVSFHLHQLRHTFACKLAEADVNPFKIQKLLGHTSLAMTLKYIRSLQTEKMEEDISKISF